jgi:uncharacterized DUF497 family protein
MNNGKSFEWDDAKAAANVAKHGLRFEIAADVFSDRALLDIDASRVTDAEARRKAVGMVEDRLITVVYTMRQGTVRIISVRPANPKERRAYASLYS